MKSTKTLSARIDGSNVKNLKTTVVGEYSTLPEKFLAFTQEGISMIWLHETSESSIRGNRSIPKS